MEVNGHWREPEPLEVGAGWYLVPTDQALGVLAAYFLEPASEDGLVTWNFLDRELAPHGEYPIYRSRSSFDVPREVLP